MRYIFILIVNFYTLFGSTIPEMAFLSYSGDAWQVTLIQSDGSSKDIKLKEEPRSFDYNFKTDAILYVGSAGKLYLYSNGSQRELDLPYEKNSYIQPSFSCGTNEAYAVELIDNNSKSTRIVLIDLKNDTIERVVSQNSSQFEPSEIDARRLLFTSLTCNVGCGKLIQELWKKDRVSGISEQVTLLNSFSNNPSVHFNGESVFFSSNKNDSYHIWAKNLNSDKRSVELTKGDFSDTSPAAITKDSFLYIHQDGANYSIMHGDIKGNSYKIELAMQYKQIRQLKVNRCK